MREIENESQVLERTSICSNETLWTVKFKLINRACNLKLLEYLKNISQMFEQFFHDLLNQGWANGSVFRRKSLICTSYSSGMDESSTEFNDGRLISLD